MSARPLARDSSARRGGGAPGSEPDPYTVRAGEAHAPAASFRARRRCLGPSLIVTGAVIGAKELVLTAKLGVAAGWALLWSLLPSCWCKPLVQAERARYTIVSGDICAYTHWCIEKGYPSFLGAERAGANWERHARGWMKALHTNAWLALIVVTCATVPYYMLGAGVLHKMGIVPEGNDATIGALSNTFTQTLGGWAALVVRCVALAPAFG